VIGVLAAWALLGLGLWLLADWWLVPSRPVAIPRPQSRPLADRLEALGQVLVEAELEQWRPGAVVLASLLLGLVAGALAFQQLGWLVPALCWAVGVASLPFVYIWRKREQLRTARQEQLAPLLEQAGDELHASQGLQRVLNTLASGGPPALQPALRRLAQDLNRHQDLAFALEGSRRRLADPIWDDCVVSLLLSHSSGGPIGETLEQLAASVRASVELKKAVAAQQAATVRAAHITLLVPVVSMLFLRAFVPGAADFYATLGGEIVLLVCAVCMGAGYWWMRRMSGVPRSRRLESHG
jgi:Flp pilus assembly protein TadB